MNIYIFKYRFSVDFILIELYYKFSICNLLFSKSITIKNNYYNFDNKIDCNGLEIVILKERIVFFLSVQVLVSNFNFLSFYFFLTYDLY